MKSYHWIHRVRSAIQSVQRQSARNRASAPAERGDPTMMHCLLLALSACPQYRSDSGAETAAPAEANAVVEFWLEAGPSLWFAKDPSFDRSFRERFLRLHEGAARGLLASWLRTSSPSATARCRWTPT